MRKRPDRRQRGPHFFAPFRIRRKTKVRFQSATRTLEIADPHRRESQAKMGLRRERVQTDGADERLRRRPDAPLRREGDALEERQLRPIRKRRLELAREPAGSLRLARVEEPPYFCNR